MTFRDAHERPEGMDAGTLIVALLGKVNLVEAVRDGYAEGRRFAGAVPVRSEVIGSPKGLTALWRVFRAAP
ncbi:hypothetical protein [Methylorubrum sp. SL192]|uniref:hypothetical protein n=1 Tax=Methylorubrum sp. SL192 TaxID=2995167 RepID=UPI002274C191|nr:hypothetical protein [Methylorubrum sp. SL192]MCY1643536.1 hypothetical protein [Methylorubrum sp. SL192]